MLRLLVIFYILVFCFNNSYSTNSLSLKNNSQIIDVEYSLFKYNTIKFKNSLSFEFFGKGGEYSFNYSRRLFSNKTFSIHGGIGLSLGYNLIIDFSCYPISIPLFIDINKYIFKDFLFINVINGISILNKPNGTTLSREESLLDEYGNLIMRHGCQFTPTFATNFYTGIGLGFSLSNKFSLQINYYRFGSFNTNSLDNRIWLNRIGVSVINYF
jgi:hypothetical protein